jgi:hypothetical protein
MDLRNRNPKAKRTCKFAAQMGLLPAKVVDLPGFQPIPAPVPDKFVAA